MRRQFYHISFTCQIFDHTHSGKRSNDDVEILTLLLAKYENTLYANNECTDFHWLTNIYSWFKPLFMSPTIACLTFIKRNIIKHYYYDYIWLKLILISIWTLFFVDVVVFVAVVIWFCTSNRKLRCGWFRNYITQ